MTRSDVPAEMASRFRRWLWPIAKWTLCLVIVAFVVRRALDLWQRDEFGELEFQVGWLVLAGIVYAAGWLPSVWFWRRLMLSTGGRVSYLDTARAYYCGHLGKYVPGKTLVLVIRAALMKDRGSRAGPAALTAAYETLLFIGVGSVLALAMSPLLFTELDSAWILPLRDLAELPVLPFLLTAVVLAIAAPLLAPLLTHLALRITPGEILPSGPQVHIGGGLVAAGLASFVAGWAIHGLSLGLTLHSLADAPFDLRNWPLWTGAASSATVVGFAAIFAPAGVGVREGVLIEALRIQPGIGEKHAVAAAVLLRAVSLVTEIALAAALYYMVRSPNERAAAQRGPR